jgi:methanogenic corrinoid protein MtbC1
MAGPGLDALLGGLAQPLQAGPRGLAPIRTLLELVKNHEGALLSAALLADAAALGPIEFLRLCAIPMIEAVGEGWERGDLGVHHEHVFSERLADALRAIRLPHERGGAGPRITLAALAGETHGLGLQMAALVAAVAGLEPHVLGVDTPAADIVAAVRARKSAVLGISISVSTGGPGSRDQLAALRRGVAASTRILVGGRGARRSHPPGGCVIVDDLASFYDSMRRLGSARAS